MVQKSVSSLSSSTDLLPSASAINPDQSIEARRAASKKDRRHRIGINEDVYALLRMAAQREGRPMSQVTADAILAYVNAQPSPS
jgi:hypothetical protein